MTDFALDRLNVNDDEHVILAWLATDGETVAAGQPIAEIETSKATVELEAKLSGLLRIIRSAGRTAKVGEIIYAIEEGEAWRAAAGSEPSSSASNSIANVGAAGAAGGASISEGPGFATRRPIRRPAGPSREALRDRGSADLGAPQGVDARKLAEIKSLSFVNPSGLVSCLYIDVSLTPRSSPLSGFFATNVSDLICYEAARLLAKFPLLNAYFDPETGIESRDQIKIGYSIDSGEDLTVYNLGECQTATLQDVRSRLLACVEAHVLKKVSASMLEPTSFTVTDLSGSGVAGFTPLVNGPQSAIVGYSQPSANAARLSLAFDHRVMGGRYAASFLTELRARIESHFSGASGFACFFCGRDAAQLRQLGARGFIKIVDTSGQERLACPLCMGGY